MISAEQHPIELSRRKLLKVLGSGLLVAAFVPEGLANLIDQRRGPQLPQVVSAWIHVGTDGKVTVLTGKVEVGQNARTSLTQAAAEELHISPESVRVIMGDTDLVPYDMGTFGSMTTPNMVPQIRRAAASAREALVDIASKKWGVDGKTLRVENGHVIGQKGSASFGELASGKAISAPIDAAVALTPATDWKVLGTSLPKIDAREFVTGKHVYSSDVRIPGMLHGKVLRAPSYGAKLKSIDTSKAKAMSGVHVVEEGEFIAVAAPTSHQAQQAIYAIKAEWTPAEQPSSKDIFKLLRGNEQTPAPQMPADVPQIGDTYTCAYIAHVPLEPRAAVAEWKGSKVTIQTGTQRPFGVRPEVATALGIPEADVRVLVPDTGSGYGGKHSGETAIEAARIAKAVGKAVSVVWTRQEEFSFAYFRPAGVDQIYSAVKKDGTLVTWECDNYNSGPPGIETPYDVESPRVQSHPSHSPLRQGSYRCLGATFNNFARETHMDRLAHEIGMDSLEFRLKNLQKMPRLQAVLKAAAERFGWATTKAPAGHGYGLACGTDKGGYIATFVEVAVDTDTKAIRVVRAVNTFECGAILNPDHLRNQIEGGVLMGLGGALFEAIEFENGRILNNRLSRYRVPRFSDVPKLETILLDRKDLPSAGAGEAPIMAIAPAIGNAVFAATNVRLKSMPLRLPT